MNQDDRTSAVGLAQFARQYSIAAIGAHEAIRNWWGLNRPVNERVNKRRDAISPAPAPVMFLLAHSIELSLKAYLRHRGVTIAELKGKEIGHDLMKCWESAREKGIEDSITLTDDDVALLEVIRDRHVSMDLRYKQTGIKVAPYYGPLQAFTEKLLDAICPVVGCL